MDDNKNFYKKIMTEHRILSLKVEYVTKYKELEKIEHEIILKNVEKNNILQALKDYKQAIEELEKKLLEETK